MESVESFSVLLLRLIILIFSTSTGPYFTSQTYDKHERERDDQRAIVKQREYWSFGYAMTYTLGADDDCVGESIKLSKKTFSQVIMSDEQLT